MKKRYKIAHNGLPHTGVGTYIRSIIENIDCTKFESILIAGNSEFSDITNKEGQPIKTYKVPFSREINLFKDFYSLYKTLKYLRQEKPDVIHAHSSKCGLIGRMAGLLLGIPVLYTPNAFSYLSTNNKVKQKIYLGLERLFGSHNNNKLLACSKSEYYRGVEEVKFPTDRALIWENSIKDPYIKLQEARYEGALPPDFIVVMGRPSYQKNLEMTLKVFSIVAGQNPDISLVILSGTSSKLDIDKLQKLVMSDLCKRVFIIDVGHEEALYILNKSKLLVSTSRYEGLPFSVLEAIALKKPCVVTNVDGNRDAVWDGVNGFLTEEFNENEMAEKILYLLSNEVIYNEIKSKSRDIFLSKFNIDNNIGRIEKIYQTEAKL